MSKLLTRHGFQLIVTQDWSGSVNTNPSSTLYLLSILDVSD
jgi:hypothetical protein